MKVIGLTVTSCVDCNKVLYPQFNLMFLFNHSQGHAKKLVGGLDAYSMIRGYGGAQSIMHESKFKEHNGLRSWRHAVLCICLRQCWTILDDRESGTVKMFKKDGVAKVAVVFHCQDTIDGDYMMDEEDEENEEEFPAEIRFLVTVTKAGKTMVLSCVALDTKVNVESVATTTEEVDEIQAKGKVHDKLYQGPQFDELAEDVKDAFHEYVTKDCGINVDVAAFISMFADFKEQEEYARWIKQVKAIVDK